MDGDQACCRSTVIRVFEKAKPSVKSLARKGDVDGLIDAAGHTKLVSGPDGRRIDVGAAIREEALLALRDIAPERAGHAFAMALDDPSDRVRCAAVVALYERGDADQLAQAVGTMPAAGGEARAIAARALFELRKPGCSSTVTDALVHRNDFLPLSDEDEALVAALVLAEKRPDAVDGVVEQLISALADKREIVTERAEALLVRLGTASTDALVRELADGAAPHRAAAVLGDLKDPCALQPLVAALSHPDPRVRCQSCFALGELRDPAAIDPLLQATRDPEHDVRVLAGAALDGMGTTAVAMTVAALLRPMLGEALETAGALSMLVNAGADPARDQRAAGNGAVEDESGTPEANGKPETNGKPRSSRARRTGTATSPQQSPPDA